MTRHIASNGPDLRRAAARRTAWIVAGVAIAIYVLFFIDQFFRH